jgi:hypothetical protein
MVPTYDEQVLIITAFVMLLFYIFGLDFAYGMVAYLSENNEPELIDKQIDGLFDAILKKELLNIIIKFSDSMLALIIFGTIQLPKVVYMNAFYWLLIFPFVIPSAIKLGSRYYDNGCIRNHKLFTCGDVCDNKGKHKTCDHFCDYTKN